MSEYIKMRMAQIEWEKTQSKTPNTMKALFDSMISNINEIQDVYTRQVLLFQVETLKREAADSMSFLVGNVRDLRYDEQKQKMVEIKELINYLQNP